MSNDPIRLKCMEFLHAQLDKKAIPQIRGGMLEDLIVLVEGARQELTNQVIAQRMEQQARLAALEETKASAPGRLSNLVKAETNE